MNIAIIAAPISNQASVVYDSIECFSKFGYNHYEIVQLIRGDIRIDLNLFDGVIVHYSTIAYPYKYELPLSSLAAMKLYKFKGTKVALVQDEQRAGYERLHFFQAIGISHLFSVAPPQVAAILYPEKERNFSVSTVLTGYISEKHKEVAKRNIPLIERELDLVYRGRKLPDWMGSTGTIKGTIDEIAKNKITAQDNQYRVDVSSDENQRIYGDKWFHFLTKGRVAIGTPSGSDFLDLWGTHGESWLPSSRYVVDITRQLTPARYQVVSPRYFDYVASGNLVALTPGEYSGIPEEFCTLDADLSNLIEILDFGKSKTAQLKVNKAKELLFDKKELTYAKFVSDIEKVISHLSGQKYPMNTFTNTTVSAQSDRESNIESPQDVRRILRKVMSKFIQSAKWVLIKSEQGVVRILRYPKSKSKRIDRLTRKFYKLVREISNFVLRMHYKSLRFLEIVTIRDYLNLRLSRELNRLHELINTYQMMPKFERTPNGQLVLKFESEFVIGKKLDIPDSRDKYEWTIDVSDFGKATNVDSLDSVRKKFHNSEPKLLSLIQSMLSQRK